MATITPIKTATAGKTYHYIWETMTETNDEGDMISDPGARDRSVQITGTIGGATVNVLGSNMISPVLATAAHWSQVHDGADNDVSFTGAPNCEIIAENMLWYKIIVVGGTGTDVDVMILSGTTI